MLDYRSVDSAKIGFNFAPVESLKLPDLTFTQAAQKTWVLSLVDMWRHTRGIGINKYIYIYI